jgi:hypothetical protein
LLTLLVILLSHQYGRKIRALTPESDCEGVFYSRVMKSKNSRGALSRNNEKDLEKPRSVPLEFRHTREIETDLGCLRRRPSCSPYVSRRKCKQNESFGGGGGSRTRVRNHCQPGESMLSPVPVGFAADAQNGQDASETSPMISRKTTRTEPLTPAY